MAPHVKSGRVRLLAVTMAKRSNLDPDWPTLQEQGVKDVDASNWTALFAPKATPAPIIDKLNAEVVKILAMPDVKERFAGGGVDTIPSSAGRTRRAREAGPRALPARSCRRRTSGRIDPPSAVIARESESGRPSHHETT